MYLLCNVVVKMDFVDIFLNKWWKYIVIEIEEK